MVIKIIAKLATNIQPLHLQQYTQVMFELMKKHFIYVAHGVQVKQIFTFTRQKLYTH